MDFVYIIVVVAIVLFLSFLFKGLHLDDYDEQQIRLAGSQGEKAAENVLLRLMNDDDHLLNNVKILYDGKPAELDKVVINRYGVFVIEVKNFSGRIYGNEEDAEWEKYKTTDAGNTYPKIIRNPLKQMNHQVWILKSYLYSKGVKVWVDGYVYMINGNSPFESEFLLNNANDVDYAIHGLDEPVLSEKQINRILKLLDNDSKQ